MQRLEGGIAAPVVGYLFDRIGPRKLVLFGVFCSGIGFIAFSRVDSIWSYYLAFFFISLAFSTAGGAVSFATVANWFIRKRSRALSVMLVGSALSGVAAKILLPVIDSIGWRDTLFFIGIGHLDQHSLEIARAFSHFDHRGHEGGEFAALPKRRGERGAFQDAFPRAVDRLLENGVVCDMFRDVERLHDVHAACEQ